MEFLNLSPEDLDSPIYRIMPQDFALALFRDKQNVLSRVSNWKDKFENFQMKLGGIVDNIPFSYGIKDDFVGQCWTSDYLSEAMWGIYANDPTKRFLRIRSTPRRLIEALSKSHGKTAHDRCFIGKVEYETEAQIQRRLRESHPEGISARSLAGSLLVKRRAFKHEAEVRLLYFGNSADHDESGLYRYNVDPHAMITQIMADPNRDRRNWADDKAMIAKETGFEGKISRSKIYDAPEWEPPIFSSEGPPTI